MVSAIVSVSLASLAVLAAEDVSVAVVVEDASAAEAADVAEAAVDAEAVVAAIEVKTSNPGFSPCNFFAGAVLIPAMRHKGQIEVHTMIMTVKEY